MLLGFPTGFGSVDRAHRRLPPAEGSSWFSLVCQELQRKAEPQEGTSPVRYGFLEEAGRLQKSISNRAGSLLRLCFPLKLLAYQRKPRGSFGGRESTMCTIY